MKHSFFLLFSLSPIFMNKEMRRWAASVWIAATACVPMSVQAQSKALSEGLQMLYANAETHNATLNSLRAAIATADAGVEVARMDKLPNISGQASFSYLGNARLWNRKFGESTSAPMPHYGNNFLLQAEQVLYAGGAIKSGITLAQQQAEMTRLAVKDERQHQRMLLTGLYLQLHNLRNQQVVFANNRSLAQKQIELMQHRREQGVSLRNDITRYELQLQQIDLGETAVTDQQSILLKELNTALGTDSVQVAWLSEADFVADDLSVGVEAEWQQRALLQHAGWQKSQLAVDMGKTQERLARADRLPKVAVMAEDHLDGPITIEVPPINKNLNYWFVGVGIRYNFSSLYKSKRNIAKAQLATAQAQTQTEVVRQGISDGVHAAYVNLGTARTDLKTRQKGVQLANENYDVVSKRYQNGMALITDLTDAANMKLEAELALANARINVLYCYYQLKYASHEL